MLKSKVNIIIKRQFSDQISKNLKNPELFRNQSYINGEWINSTDNQRFEVHNPSTYPKDESLLGQVQSIDTDQVDFAVESATEAFKTFKKTTNGQRADLLRNFYELMMENKEDLARLIVLENGKPYGDAMGEVNYAASYFKWFSNLTAVSSGDLLAPPLSDRRTMVIKQPIGVVGVLTPWNFPAAMITRKMAAYIGAGCTGVIKPAHETPFTALAMGHLQELAGFPKGVNNFITSNDAAGVGKQLCEHPSIKKISFTGSTNVGKLLMAQSSSTLKKLSFELGGNAPFIVFDDANIDLAVNGAIASKFRSSGQTCVCANRLFVHESIYDEFSQKLATKLKETVKLGDGLDKSVTHGPIIHQRSFDKVRSHIEDAVSKGANIIFGGNSRPDLGENYHDLTVLGDVTPEMLINQEETFGPVCPLIKFSSEEEVLHLANDTDVGLAGYFFSENVSRIMRVGEELEVGMIGINTGLISDASIPFGGVKHSGFGREGSKYGMDEYMNIKTMVLGGI